MQAKVTADLKNNQLQITFPDTINEAKLNALYTDVRFGVADLKPGFNIIADFTHCADKVLNGVSCLEKILKYPLSYDAGRTVLVGDGTGSFFLHLAEVSQKVKGLDVIFSSTLDEVEAKLIAADFRSKRSGYRYKIHDQQVSFTTSTGQQGAGGLVNISTGGCAVCSPSAPMSSGENILIYLEVDLENNQKNQWEFKAEVVRVEEKYFAVKFLNLDTPRQIQLSICLAQEARRTLLLTA